MQWLIYEKHGLPNLSVTVTTNPNWKITDNLYEGHMIAHACGVGSRLQTEAEMFNASSRRWVLGPCRCFTTLNSRKEGYLMHTF
ncbi:hypothetical protein RRG08_028181 [Elysia crispata]|uniref:Uncharacterized protein n=1 Tax=Elysia crispata TaxID=231223 RepID=A0AAE1B9B0_9GAST|nr:hypothetical protein RRG08_028181 [Elysia crispata]